MPTADNNARGANDERHDDGGAAAGGGEERRPRPTKIKPPTPKCGRGGLCNRCVTPEGCYFTCSVVVRQMLRPFLTML